MRGVAILAVLAYHSQLLRGGFLGVDLFFALSGFLITTLLLREQREHGDVRVTWFWARRFLRLAPALVLAVLFAVVASSSLGLELRAAWAVAALGYAANLLIAYGATYPLGLVSHTWSLAMEEQFYLCWPLLLSLAARRGMRALVALAGGLSIVPILLRLAYARAHGAEPEAWLRIYFAPEMRIDALAVGCLAALVLATRPTLSRREQAGLRVAFVLSLAALGMLSARADIATLVASPILFTVTALASASLVVGAVRLPLVIRVLSAPPLVALGKISYGLYLVHVIVFNLMSEEVWLAQWAVAIVLAAASHLWVERPFLRLKTRFERPAVVDAPRAMG